MYSIHLSAIDKAGNHKTGRGLLFYDNISVIDKKAGKVTQCKTASKNTSYTWVVQNTNFMKIDWNDRFINQRHKHNLWLNKVETYAPPGDNVYEDIYGKRTNQAIKHIHGLFVLLFQCVQFRTELSRY